MNVFDMKAPLAVIDELFRSMGTPTDGNSNWGVLERLQEQAIAQPIPLLKLDAIDQTPNNSLVRYVGMVRMV
jgi:hypothetical protein